MSDCILTLSNPNILSCKRGRYSTGEDHLVYSMKEVGGIYGKLEQRKLKTQRVLTSIEDNQIWSQRHLVYLREGDTAGRISGEDVALVVIYW